MKKLNVHLIVAAIAVLVLLVTCEETVVSGTNEEAEVDDGPQTLIDIAHTGSKGNAELRYGFLIESYPGSSLLRVELLMSASVAGQEELELIVSRDNYLDATADPAGVLLGTTTSKPTLRAHGDIDPFTWVSFEFDEAASPQVEPGDIVVFRLKHVPSDPANPAVIYYAQDAAQDQNDPRVIQTLDQPDGSAYDPNGLFAIRRSYIPIRVIGHPAP